MTNNLIYKVGDKVTIIKGSRYEGGGFNNIRHGTVGVIESADGHRILPYKVSWVDGVTSRYDNCDLELIQETPEKAKFVVGDIVTINPCSQYECKDASYNPPNGVKGAIDRVFANGVAFKVKWNVSGCTNYYKPVDLDFVKKSSKKPLLVKRKLSYYGKPWETKCKDFGIDLDGVFEVLEKSPSWFILKGMEGYKFDKDNFDIVENVPTIVDESVTKAQDAEPSMKAKETEMSKRRVVDVLLMDNDKGLDVSLSLVASYKGVVTEDDDATTVQEVMMNHNIAAKLKAHNEKRVTQIDMNIRANHGTEVNLLPIKLKDLTWVVK